MVTIPSRAQTAGIPSQYSEDIAVTDIYLITGHEPAVLTKDEIFALNQTIPALTPVGRNADGDLVPAVYDTVTPANAIDPIGITIIEVVVGAVTKLGSPIYRAGCFNPAALNWPATFDTDAKKFAAFEGAPSPTNIIMRSPKTYTV